MPIIINTRFLSILLPMSLFRFLPIFILAAPLAAFAVEPVIGNSAEGAAADNLKRAIGRSQSEFLPGRPAPVLNNNSIEQSLPDLGDASSRVVSSEDERILAEQIMRAIRKDPSYLDDPLLSDYLNDLGRRLARTLQADPAHPTTTFEIFGVRDSTINAFAMPGGFIGIHTGLLALTESESELASVLGHEMGHVLQKHYARGQEKEGRNILWALGGIALGVLAASRGSDNLGQGLMVGGQALAIDKGLVFSRDAEREADRVGFQTLQANGFDTKAAPLFFERLQRANSLNESSQTSYARTHPLTSERIADMQNRSRTVQSAGSPPPSLAFYLARARGRVLQASSSALQNLQRSFEGSLNNPNLMTAVSAWYGKALIAQQLGTWDEAEAALVQARQLLSNSPTKENNVALDVTQIELALQRKQTALAVQLAEAANRNFPTARALGIVYIRALIAAGRFRDAQNLATTKSQQEPKELAWWDLLAQAYAAAGKLAQQHRALAERYILLASWSEALEQLQIARRSGDADFYVMSEIDARISQIKKIKRDSERDLQP